MPPQLCLIRKTMVQSLSAIAGSKLKISKTLIKESMKFRACTNGLPSDGTRYGIPTLAVTAVGKEMARDARYFRLATRICAELGAHYIKTYYIDEGFETVTASCPVPIVMAGGKKIPELDALTMAYKAIQEGASGVDMGRNIFQSESPTAMIQAVGAVVHDNETPEKAFEFYNTLKNQS